MKPTYKLKRPRNSITEEPKEKTKPTSLSRLCRYPNTQLDKNCPSKVQQSFASLARSVRNTLILNLMSEESFINVDYMIDLSNAAFASLNSFQSDYRDLYDVVKEFILNQSSNLEAKKKLDRCAQHWTDLLVQSIISEISRDDAKSEFENAKALVLEAEAEAASLEARIEEARALLNGLEEKLEKGNEEVEFLRSESCRFEKTYVDSEAEFRDLDKRLFGRESSVQRSFRTVLRLGRESDRAKEKIERSKAKLRALHRHNC